MNDETLNENVSSIEDAPQTDTQTLMQRVAVALTTEPTLFSELLEWYNSQGEVVGKVQEELANANSQISILSEQANSLNSQLDQSKNFNAMLMQKIPMNSFATPKEDVKINPMEQFLKGLDENGIVKKF